jgi:hypothetical protein
MFKLITLLLANSLALAVVFLDIEVTHEKGFEDKMILKSELMSREKVFNNKPFLLQMKNGIQLSFNADFDEKKVLEDEASIIVVEGLIQDLSAKTRSPKRFKLELKNGIKGEYKFETDEGQRTKILITPVVK